MDTDIDSTCDKMWKIKHEYVQKYWSNFNIPWSCTAKDLKRLEICVWSSDDSSENTRDKIINI